MVRAVCAIRPELHESTSFEVKPAMTNKRPLVMIMGKKDGLVLKLDDQCAYHDLLEELKARLSERRQHYSDGPLLSVKVEAGNRYLDPAQREEIQAIIRSEKMLVVEEITSNVMTVEECDERLRRQSLLQVRQTVRSGQVLEAPGDLLVIGDVNPGGQVVACGNIYIMGALRGIAHAGADGASDKVIVSSLMKPTQLKIGSVFSRSADVVEQEGRYMECAYVDPNTGRIAVDRLQSYIKRFHGLARMSYEGVK